MFFIQPTLKIDPFNKRSYDSLFVTFHIPPKTGLFMTQQARPEHPGRTSRRIRRPAPAMIASADDRTAWRFVDFFAVTIRNPQPGRPTTAPSPGSWTGASRGASTGSPPSGPSTSRPTSSSSPSRALGQTAPLRHQQVLRLDGLRGDARRQPGDFGPETQTRRQGRQDPGAQRRPGPDAARFDINR